MLLSISMTSSPASTASLVGTVASTRPSLTRTESILPSSKGRMGFESSLSASSPLTSSPSLSSSNTTSARRDSSTLTSSSSLSSSK